MGPARTTFYNRHFEDLDPSRPPRASSLTRNIAWAHSDEASDDGSSQFSVLFTAELPRLAHLIDAASRSAYVSMALRCSRADGSDGIVKATWLKGREPAAHGEGSDPTLA